MKKNKILLLVALLIVTGLFTTACDNKEKNGNDGYDYLVLVNKYSQLPDDWEKNVELVDAKNAWDEDIKIEKNAYKQYKALKKELKEDGVEIELDSVYRSVKAQQDLWDEWSADPEKGIDYVRKFVAVPGYSEHHTGLAVDICIKKDGELISDNDEMIAEREIFAKIHKKLAKYGFILRYLEGREDSTGYTYEPWHLRYINSPEIAKEIMDKEMTFEEYLDSRKDLKELPSAVKYKIETIRDDEEQSVPFSKLQPPKDFYHEIEEICAQIKYIQNGLASNLFYNPEDKKYISDFVDKINKEIAITRVNISKTFSDEL